MSKHPWTPDALAPNLSIALHKKMAELEEEMLEESVLPLLAIGFDPMNGKLCFFPCLSINTDALTDVFNRGLETVREIAEGSEP